MNLVLFFASPGSVAAAAAGQVASAQPLAAASAAAGRLIVEVGDTLGGVLPGATVVIVGPLPAETSREIVTEDTGRAAIADLAPGRYSVRVTMPGFEPAATEDVTVKAGGSVRRALTLRIASFTDEVTVTRDAAERRLSDNFSETLSDAEIDQLPDDPEEAAALIAELAGPDAEIRINGFEGTDLPPKSQIQSIRVRHDPFGADGRGAGRPRVEIITKPGSSGWEHHFNAGLRDQSIDARNPFAEERGEGQTRRLRWSSSGPLIRNRTSVAFSLSTTNAFDLQPIVAAVPGSASNAVSRQNRNLNAEVRLEHGLTPAHTLRVEYRRRSGERNNLGVGEFSLPERAYDTTSELHRFRVSDIGTFGKKAFNELRFEVVSSSDDRSSRSDAITVDVANAFTAGGAQVAGATRLLEIEIENDLEVALSDRHRLRIGLDAEFGRVRTDESENASGRFTFASLEAYQAGRPILFVQRVGNPGISYARYDVSWYIHDELRLRDDLQLGLGLRHDVQSFTDDWANFSPRASVAWSPRILRGITIRAGGGLFAESYAADLHEQTLRLDGVRQRDLIVSDPGWPDPSIGAGGIELPPPSIIRANDSLMLPTTRRVSVGVQKSLGDAVDLRFNVFDEATSRRLRSVDANAPVDGMRLTPDLARVTEIRSIGRAEERGVEASLRARVRELFGTVRYRWAREMNDADGALSLPADSSNLAAEWGPASNDVRHRFFGYMRLRLPFGVGLGLNARVFSGAPYTVRTGFDDNSDQVANDRPAGVGRNTERGSWQKVVGLRLGWTVGGHPNRDRNDQGPRRADRGTEIYTQISNLFNTTNLTRYAGVRTSPYFGQPTAAQPGRRMELGLRVFF